MALQMDGTRQEMLTSRHDDATATLLGTGVDGFLDGLLILLGSIGSFCTIFGNGEVLCGKLRHTDALLNLTVLLLIPALRLNGQYGKDKQ